MHTPEENASRRHILVVDDDVTLLSALVTHLRRQGHRVAACSSADEVRARLVSEPFDTIVSDNVLSRST